MKRFNAVKVGLPWESDTQMGCQISKRQMEKILGYVEIGKKEGIIMLVLYAIYLVYICLR